MRQRYGWINRALPADKLHDFVSALAHRIANFRTVGLTMAKEQVNAIALAPVEDFRRDSDLFGESAQKPGKRRANSRPRSSVAFRLETRKWSWADS